MSHFVVLVVGDDVEKQLAPYQENNIGDCPKEYLEFEDCTEEILEDWENGTRQEFYANRSYHDPEGLDALDRLQAGEVVKNYPVNGLFGEINGDSILKIEGDDDEEIWFKVISSEMIDDTRRNHKVDMVRIAPPEKISVKDVYKDIDEMAEKRHGYKKDENGRYGYWTNPNTKWDWYSIGGRWSGYLKLKKNENVVFNPEGFTHEEIAGLVDLIGKDGKALKEKLAGYMTKETAVKQAMKDYIDLAWPTECSYGQLSVFADLAIGKKEKTLLDYYSPGYCDATRKRHIDVEGMEAPKRETAARIWDGMHQEREGGSWAEMIKALPAPSKEAPFGDTYQNLPREFREFVNEEIGFFSGYDEILQIATMSREEYIACESIWAPYALVWNGKWYSSGDMGWFGISTNEEKQWKGSFRELWAEIPDNAMITTVDCHI